MPADVSRTRPDRASRATRRTQQTPQAAAEEADLRVTVLGPTRATLDGVDVDLGARKPRAVFALLAIQAGEPVSVEALIDGIWGEAAPETAENTLQVYVAGLRRSLGAARDLLATTPPGYRLNVEPDAVDALRFERAVESARRGSAYASAWRAALAIWTGEPFADLMDLPFTLAAGARLRELRLAAGEQCIDAELAEGHHADVVAELETAVAAEPYRERTWRQLILALYRNGRQADALAAFRRARTVLADDLGLDPGPALQALEHAVLVQDPALDPVLPAAPSSFSVPRPVSALLGRQEECDALAKTVTSGRMTTLTGPGGVGKTRLAVEVAHDVRDAFPDGVVFVDAASVRDASTLIAETARAVGAGGMEAPIDALAAALSRRRVLLVLDNLEQIPDAGPGLAGLLARASQTHVLATSRVAVRISGEVVVPLGPLDPADATDLFMVRAAAVRADLADTAAADITARLDGLPLAIELAAASCRGLAPAEVLRRLTERLPLPGGPRDLPDRQRTLRATLSWSYDLLPPEARRHLVALAAFRSPFTIEAAGDAFGHPAGPGRVGASDPARVDLAEPIAELVEASLLVRAGDRYQMLQTVRDFARTIPTDGDGVDDQHAGWVIRAVLAAEPRLHGADELTARRELADIVPDIRAAIAHLTATGQHQEAAGILLGTTLVWFHEGLLREADQHVTSVAAGALEPRLRAELAATHGVWTKLLGRNDEAIPILGAATADLRALAIDSVARVNGLCHLASVEAENGQRELAFGHADEAVEVARRISDPGSLPMALDLAAYVARILGDDERALLASRAAVDAARSTDSPMTAYALSGYAAALAQSGRADEAFDVGWEALATAESTGSPAQLAGVTTALSGVFGRSDPAGFAPRLARSIATWLALGAAPSAVDAGWRLAELTFERDPAGTTELLAALAPRAGPAEAAEMEPMIRRSRERLGAAESARHQAAGSRLDDDQVSRLAARLAEGLAEPP